MSSFTCFVAIRWLGDFKEESLLKTAISGIGLKIHVFVLIKIILKRNQGKQNYKENPGTKARQGSKELNLYRDKDQTRKCKELNPYSDKGQQRKPK